MAEKTTMSFARPQQGAFSLAIYRQVLEKVIEGNVFTLTVSTGDEERIFFFTRGAILFLAVGTSGGEVLARKLVAKGLLPPGRVDELVKRANSGTPLLQDILREEMILDPKRVSALVEETLEDHLLEVMLFENALALYDLVPGNPPPRLYAPEVPALRLSVGSKPLLERVLAKRDEAMRTLATLGALRNRVRAAPGAAIDAPVGRHLAAEPRPITAVLVAAQLAGEPAWRAASSLAALVQAKAVELERVPERSKQEELAHALRIEDAFEGFLNGLLARTHLAAIYERANEKEKAAEQYRGIAEEHFKRDALDAGLAALRNVLRLLPQDVAARELVVKVLQGAGRLGDAAREAVDLGRVFLDLNFPGRARQAFELALRLVPSNASVLWMLAGLLSLLGEKEAAVRRYEELVELAQKAGDEAGALAAAQAILDLAPAHAKALELVRRLTGYKDAVRKRVAAVSASFVIFLLVVAWGTYELAALSALRRAREQALAALAQDAPTAFDVARSAVEEWRARWRFSRLGGAADSLRRAIDEEERVFATRRSLEEERQARALEAKLELPEAQEHARAALAFARDPERKQALEALGALLAEKVRQVDRALSDARQYEHDGHPRQGYDLVAAQLPGAPWLARDPSLRVPMLLETSPRGARITFDGEPQEKAPPLLLHRPFTPVRVSALAPNREPLERELVGPQPWPVVLVLPRKPIWVAKDVAARSAALAVKDQLFLGSDDRSVVAVARDTGAVLWRAPLGAFFECEAPPALGDGVLYARACSGPLALLAPASGAVRATVELEPPPRELLERHPERPIAAPHGAIVRTGARGLALVAAAPTTEKPTLWQTRAPADLVGAPALAAGLVLVSGERRLLAFKAETGELAFAAELEKTPVLGPVAGPKGTIAVPLEPAALALLDPRTKNVKTVRDVFDVPISAIEGDARFVLVASQVGDVAALDEAGKVVFHAFTEQQRPILWIRSQNGLVLFADAAMLYALDRDGKELWRQPVSEGAEATADERAVYQSAAGALSAFDR